MAHSPAPEAPLERSTPHLQLAISERLIEQPIDILIEANLAERTIDWHRHRTYLHWPGTPGPEEIGLYRWKITRLREDLQFDDVTSGSGAIEARIKKARYTRTEDPDYLNRAVHYLQSELDRIRNEKPPPTNPLLTADEGEVILRQRFDLAFGLVPAGAEPDNLREILDTLAYQTVPDGLGVSDIIQQIVRHGNLILL